MRASNTDLGWLTRQPYAHRGLHDAAAGTPENSLSALSAAVAGGYGIEIDVQAAVDGTPMVFHDETLHRMTGREGDIAALSAAELRAVRLKGSEDGIPTLAEALDCVAGRTPMLIEIKHHGDSDGTLEAAVLETVRDYAGPFALMSFEPSALMHLRRLAPDVPRGLVSEAYWLRPFWPHVSGFERLRRRLMLHAIRTAPHFIAYHWRDLRNPFLRLALRVRPRPLLSWTVRKPEESEIARGRRADQIIFEDFRP